MPPLQDQTSNEKRYCLYGLIAQLALDGKPNAKVSYHTMGTQPNVGQGKALQRFTIQPNREKMWVCNVPRRESAPAPGSAESEPVPATLWHNIGKFVDVGNLPNMYMQIAWDVTVERQGNQDFIQFERPYLIWNKTINFKKDQWFRWA